MPLTYLITGASRGLGLEFARQLSARGDTVIGTARTPPDAAQLGRAAKAVVPLDVADEASIRSLPEHLKNAPIDVLINNAGISSETRTLQSLTAAELQRVFMINSIAPLLVGKAVLGNLRSGSRKLVVNITSQLGSIAHNTGGSTYGYRASKTALNMLTVSMARELAPEGFTCVAIHPGWVRTDMGGPRATLSPEESVKSMIAVLDRLGPDDTAKFLNYDGAVLPW